MKILYVLSLLVSVSAFSQESTEPAFNCDLQTRRLRAAHLRTYRLNEETEGLSSKLAQIWRRSEATTLQSSVWLMNGDAPSGDVNLVLAAGEIHEDLVRRLSRLVDSHECESGYRAIRDGSSEIPQVSCEGMGSLSGQRALPVVVRYAKTFTRRPGDRPFYQIWACAVRPVSFQIPGTEVYQDEPSVCVGMVQNASGEFERVVHARVLGMDLSSPQISFEMFLGIAAQAASTEVAEAARRVQSECL